MVVFTVVLLAVSAAAWCSSLEALRNESVSLAVTVDSYDREAKNDDCNNDIADPCESLLPDLVAESDALECAPEAVAEVKAESSEPNNIDDHHPKILECVVKKDVWVGCMLSHPLLKLHL
jgi:hypothetical protein